MRYIVGRESEEIDRQLGKLLNKGLTLVDNIEGGLVEISTSGGVETINHNLGFTPIGWLIIYKDASVELIATQVGSWDNQTMFLQSNAPNVTVRLFVM